MIHHISQIEINYQDNSYMFSIDSPLLYYKVASAGSHRHLVLNRSSQALVRFSDTFSTVDLESSSSGELTSGQTYMSLPGNTGYLVQYKSDVLFQNGVVDMQDACRLDDCRTHWTNSVISAPIVSVGTGISGGSTNQTTAIQLTFQSLQVCKCVGTACVM